jgi:protein-tyrosine phosphatase
LARGEFDFSADPDSFPLTVWLRALTPGNPTSEAFAEAVTALKSLVKSHGNVVVHCHHGLGRSVAVVAAYLVEAEGLSPEAALHEVAGLRGGRREISQPLCSLVERYAD